MSSDVTGINATLAEYVAAVNAGDVHALRRHPDSGCRVHAARFTQAHG